MLKIWRLNERTEANLGLALTCDGLFLGRTPLITRHDARFVVRSRVEIDRLLSHAYQNAVTVRDLMPRLAAVAAALNAGDQCLACIAAVHLQIPDLPGLTARKEMEAEDFRIRSDGRGQALSLPEILKASPDDPEHPGWPAGAPDGRGGKFRPKDDLETAIADEVKSKIERIAMRRALRTGALAVLRVSAEGVANLVPFLGLVADAAMVVDIARTIAEYRRLSIDVAAAIDFVKKGPYNLADLQVAEPRRGSNGYEEFSSYYSFYKSDFILELLMAKRFGAAGDGYQYHHIVTQGGTNEQNIPPELLHNTDNIIRLPTLLHEAVSAEYSKMEDGKNMTVYQWLQTQPYDVQRQRGLKILRELHILK